MSNLFVRSRPTTNWAANTAYVLGDRRKATAAKLGIHFEVTTAGTSHATTEPTWNTTVGGTTADGTVTWTTRGSAAPWVALTAYVLGDRVIATSSATAARQNYVYECTTAGTSLASEPTWVTTTPDVSTTTEAAGPVWTLRKCSTWDNAHCFLARIFGDTSGTGKTAVGDTVYVSHTHSETGAAGIGVNITFPGTATNANSVICVNDVGDPSSPGTAATTAVVASATTGTLNFFGGHAYIYGITFSAGSGSSNTSLSLVTTTPLGVRFEACRLKINSTGTATIRFGSSSAGGTTSYRVELENTVLQFGAVGQGIRFSGGEFYWHNTASAIAGSAPTALIVWDTNGLHLNANFVGLDLAGATGALVTVSSVTAGLLNFVNCKLGSGFTFTTGTHAGIGGPEVNFINCDSGSTNYNYYRETAQGTIVDEGTFILTGGASDGTTPISWKMATNANSKFGWPLVSAPIVAWNDATGAKTATVEILSAATLTDADVWVEVDYLANSGDPGGLAVSDRAATPVATAANQTSSAASWAGGLGGATPQKLSVAFTANKKGAVRARVMLAKASVTALYVNPKLTIA
jgi:hypothetical protein